MDSLESTRLMLLYCTDPAETDGSAAVTVCVEFPASPWNVWGGMLGILLVGVGVGAVGAIKL